MSRGPRWAWHLSVAAITVVLASLGFWQLDRHRQLQEENARLEARLAADPQPYETLMRGLDPDAAPGAPDDAANRPVVVEGRFDAGSEVLLRGRSYEDQPGYHVLTPLLLSSADTQRAVLVDRGWVPYRIDEPGHPDHAPPAGAVRVTGRLMPEEDPPTGPLSGLAPRDPPTGALEIVARADVDRLADQVPYPLDPYVVQAEAIAPREPDGAAGGEGAEGAATLPIVPPRPGPEPGPHVGYAIQWFAFALTAAVGYVLLIRRRD